MPDIQSSTVQPTASMTVRPQFTYASGILSKLTWKQQEDLDRHKALLRWRRIIESDITTSTTGSDLEQLILKHMSATNR